MPSLTLTFYSEIGDGEASRVLTLLRANPSADVEVRINSPGGSVAEGLAIFNALKPRKPIVYIDGVAASIASFIAMAGARIIAAENALIMIHDPWVSAEGNSAELRRTADLLDKHRDAILGAYSRSGLSSEELISLLAAETWMTADEALALGFVDEVAEPLRYAAHAPVCFAGYSNVPQELLMPNTNNQRGARAADPASTPAPAVPAESAAPRTPATAEEILAAFQQGLGSDAVATAASNAVMQVLRDRNAAIVAMATPFMGRPRIQSYTMEALADPTVTVDNYRDRMMALVGQDSVPLAGNYRMSGGHDAVDFVAAASDALAMRAGIKVDKPHAGVRDIKGMAVGDIARACVSRSGRALDIGSQSRGALIRAAMTTSDFPAILENTLGKALRAGLEAEPSTIDAWTRKVMVPDFKPQSRVILGSGPELLSVPEGGEYQFGSMDEDKSVPYSVGKFGRIVGLSWEALINDDLGAFLRMAQALGQAAARTEADAVYNTFAENAGAGPAMQDSVNLFHASHANLADSVTAVDAAALGSARVLLRRQTAVGGGVMNLTPRFLLVAPEHEQAAETLLAAAVRSLSQGSDNALVPAWLAQLQLVVEARLTDAAFYLLTGPESVDTLERAWLEADNGPVTEQEDGFTTDARKFKVRHVFGQRWLDWRGAVKVPVGA